MLLLTYLHTTQYYTVFHTFTKNLLQRLATNIVYKFISSASH